MTVAQQEIGDGESSYSGPLRPEGGSSAVRPAGAYYARITQFDGEMAWSSPIWIA